MSHTRTMNYIGDLNQLREGDILMFRAPQKPGIAGWLIQFVQSLIRKTHGHFDTTHTAICTGKDVDNKVLIAHVTGRLMQDPQERLEDMIVRDGGGDRAFVVYRPANADVGKEIARVAGNSKQNQKMKYNLLGPIATLFRDSLLDPKQKPTPKKRLSASTFCTKFVVQAMKLATKPADDLLHQEREEYYPYIRSSCTPKSLEAYFYNDSKYEMLVYTGNTNPYVVMQYEIAEQIKRIAWRSDEASRHKCAKLKEKLFKHTQRLDASSEDNLHKAIALLQKLTKTLKMNTGFNFFTATSYRAVMRKARSMAIFERDIVRP